MSIDKTLLAVFFTVFSKRDKSAERGKCAEHRAFADVKNGDCKGSEMCLFLFQKMLLRTLLLAPILIKNFR